MTRIAIEMPKLGYDMASGVVAGWLKKPGDSVVRGEAIAEITTEKVTVEMEAVWTGILVEIVAEAGTEHPVGATIGWLDDGT